MSDKMVRACVCLRLADAGARNHLTPIVRHPLVESLQVVRHAAVRDLDSEKITTHAIGLKPLPIRLMQMYMKCRQLFRSGSVNSVISFNPFPYGMISLLSRQDVSVPYHLGLIGTDWYGKYHSAVWRRMTSVLKNATFITVTGNHMKDQVIAAGVAEDRVWVLPHTVDIDRFVPGDPDSAEFDLLFVGRLIKVKRVDLILDAVGSLNRDGHNVKLCVVGDGPLRHELVHQSWRLGIENNVKFAGYSHEVESYMAKSRILVSASDSEGYPFSIVEAMSSGLIPVSTDVGTISDNIRNGENGFLVARGDHEALAGRLAALLDDRELFDRIRGNIMSTRQGLSYETATAAWDPWLRGLVRS